MPLRLRGLHLVHPPWYIYYVLVVIKQFLSTKLQERVRLTMERQYESARVREQEREHERRE